MPWIFLSLYSSHFIFSFICEAINYERAVEFDMERCARALDNIAHEARGKSKTYTAEYMYLYLCMYCAAKNEDTGNHMPHAIP